MNVTVECKGHSDSLSRYFVLILARRIARSGVGGFERSGAKEGFGD